MFCISIYNEGINTKLHLHYNTKCTTTPSAHLETDHFLSWLYIPDFRMFCISMYSEGINTKPYLHYKTNCTS